LDALNLASLTLSVGSIVVAAVVAVIVGRRRGIDQVEDRADGEIKKLVEAQAARLTLLEAENREQRARIATLEGELAKVRQDLDIEKRVTARQRDRDRAAQAEG
jgi:TolA-binding protein